MTASALDPSANVTSPHRPILGGVPRTKSPKFQVETPFQYITEVYTNQARDQFGPRFAVQSRVGIAAPVAYNSHLEDSEQIVVIRHVYRFNSVATLADLLTYPRLPDEAVSEEARLVYQRLLDLDRGRTNFTRPATYEVVIEYRYTLQEIEELGGAIYSPETDLVICQRERINENLHPASRGGEMANFLAREVPFSRNGFAMGLSINDPNNMIGTKYVHSNGQIFCIVPEHNNRSPPGVTVHSTRASNESTLITGMGFPTTFGMAEYAEHCQVNPHALKLYDSFSAARAALMTDNTNLKLGELEHARSQLEANVIKLQHEAEQAKQKADMAELQHQQTIEELKRKEAYEVRSYARKDTSDSFKFSTEMIKYVPLIAIGLGAAYVAIKTAYSRGG